MGETSQAATKLRRGSPVSDGKTGVSCTRAIQFAAQPMAKRHKTNFTHKDSLRFLFNDGSDEISPPPLEGEVDARSAAGGVTAPKGARASGIAVHPTPPAGACHRAGHFGPDPLGGRPSPCRAGESHMQNELGIAALFPSTCSKDDSVLFAFRFPYAIALPCGGGWGGGSGGDVRASTIALNLAGARVETCEKIRDPHPCPSPQGGGV